MSQEFDWVEEKKEKEEYSKKKIKKQGMAMEMEKKKCPVSVVNFSKNLKQRMI